MRNMRATVKPINSFKTDLLKYAKTARIKLKLPVVATNFE
jgi:hypothetical protein